MGRAGRRPLLHDQPHPSPFLLAEEPQWDHSLLLIAAAGPGAFLGTYFLKSLEPVIIMKILGVAADQ